MKVWNDGVDFFNELKNDPRVSEVLTVEELEENFDLSYHLKHVDTIFTRVFGKI
jgi:adenylosuccinate lyase